MTNPMRNIGDSGEELATEYLKKRGYIIIENNWLCRFGELDIVAKLQGLLVFIEVKTRKTNNIEDALSSLTVKKREKLINAIYIYLDEHQLNDSLWRFDVIAIALPKGKKPLLEHVEDALDW